MRERVTLFGIGGRLSLPQLAPRLGVERDHPRVEGRQKERVAGDRHTAERRPQQFLAAGSGAY